MSEQRPVAASLRVIINGYAADLEASGTLEDLVGLTKKLEHLGEDHERDADLVRLAQ